MKNQFLQSKLFFCLICCIAIQQPLEAQVVLKNSGSYLKVGVGTTLHIGGDLTNENTGTIENNGTIHVSENITNNASNTMQTGTGTLELNGTAAQNISGTNTIDCYNLTINNNSTGAILGTGISVSNFLTMTDGDVDLNGQMIDLATTGTLTGETNTNRIFGTSGTIQATRDLNAPTAENVAGLGVEITSAANLGTTIISRGHGVQTVNTNSSIERYFDITPTTNTGLDATITFNYFDNEIAGQTEADLLAWKSDDAGTTWSSESGTIDVANNNLTKTGVDGFSRWTLSQIICGTASLKVFLEGPFSGGVMSTTLNDNHLLPGQDKTLSPEPSIQFFSEYTEFGQPYRNAPWNHTDNLGSAFGDASSPDAPAITIPYDADVTDWILVTVREDGLLAADNVWSCAGWVHADGAVSFPEECPCLAIDNTKNYYVAVQHRNHLGILSSLPVAITDGGLTLDWDFTIRDSYKGFFSVGQKEVATGVWAMHVGNGDQMTSLGAINATDQTIWKSSLNQGNYRNGDFNLDVFTNSVDETSWKSNLNKYSDVDF